VPSICVTDDDHLLTLRPVRDRVRTRGFVVNQTQDHDGQQCAALRWLESDIPIEPVPVALLQPGESPRLKGESKAHIVRLLAATGIPPIIVHRSTMGIIDGRARVAAARCRHQDTIAARFFEGSSTEEAFVLGVVANLTTHGRPLSRQDRNADAARILQMYPGWSDHVIAATAGLSPPTVAAIRGCSTKNSFQLNTRRGRDGKNRPVDANEGRREVARRAGVSVGTAHDVRCRLKQGVDPSVSKTRRGPTVDYHLARGQAVLTKLESNPSVSLHDDGKALLRLLYACLRLVQQASPMIMKVPEHCLDMVADFAAAVSDAWGQLARDVRVHAKHLYAQRN
jgi:hypothetical protein